MQKPDCAIIFDLDGVLTDTAELHYQSWQWLMDQMGIPFDRQRNEALRGLSRTQSLEIILGDQTDRYTADEKADLTRRKNDNYLERVAKMTPADLLPGVERLLGELREQQIPIAVASSSKNAEVVLDRIGIRAQIDALVDGNEVPNSKPDPRVFLVAAEKLNAAPNRCVVIEDASSGVAAGLAAGMKVVGLGPDERVGKAHHVATGVCDLHIEQLRNLLAD